MTHGERGGAGISYECDALIVGCGAAGMSAAVTAASTSLTPTSPRIVLRPFYAIKMVIGDLGTHSGNRTGGRMCTKRRPRHAKGPEGPFDTHTASFAALTGRARTIFRAGLALNTIGSPLKGLVPLRALVAGFLITTNLAKPGTRKTPFFLSSL
jgi:hypothetical protein